MGSCNPSGQNLIISTELQVLGCLFVLGDERKERGAGLDWSVFTKYADKIWRHYTLIIGGR